MRNEEIKLLEIVTKDTILGREVNVYDDIEHPYFEAREIAGWIGIKNVSQMLKQAEIEESEKAIFLKYTLGGNQKSLFITEDAMYEVLMTSRKKEANELRKQIKAYLKSIRKTGAAIQPGREEEMVQKYFPSFSKEVQTEMVNDLIRQNKELKEFYDDLINTQGYMSINTCAKELGIGEYKLFSFLRSKKVFFYDKDMVNVPYQRFMNEGKFVVKETPCHDGEMRSVTYATKKGLDYMRKLLRKNGYYDTLASVNN